MYRHFLILALHGLAAAPAFAEQHLQMRDGLWEITIHTNSPGTSPPPPNTSQSCYSKQDIASGNAAVPKSERCDIENYDVRGNVATWQIKCRGEGEVTGNGQLTFVSDTAYYGSIQLRIRLPGHPDQYVSNRYDARRLGGCAQ